MKKLLTLVLTVFVFSGAVTAAQMSPSTNTRGTSQAQPLRRYKPQLRSIERKVGEDTFSFSMEKSISAATAQALIGYFTQHYVSRLIVVEIDKLPGTDNRYVVTGVFDKGQQAQDSSKAPSILLVLSEEGGAVSEISRAESEDGGGYGVLSPVFFGGKDKLLIIVSLSSVDGDARMDLVYEYADNALKPLGQFDVIEKLGMNGNIWRIDSPVGSATAEYKNNAYYVTMRGLRGSLYGGPTDAKGFPKKLASRRTPVTFFYTEGTWRQAKAD